MKVIEMILDIVKLLIFVMIGLVMLMGIFHAGELSGQNNIEKYCVDNGVAEYQVDQNGFKTWVLKNK